MSDVTRILAQIQQDPRAADQLLPLIYDELRKLAAAKLSHEKPGQTLQATALVHEAYLRLVAPGVRSQGSGVREDSTQTPNLSSVSCPLSPALNPEPRTLNPASFSSRGHFFAAAAEAMRRILIENARHKASLKRGGALERIELTDLASDCLPLACDDLLGLNDALQKLKELHPRKAELVNLRFFAGLTTAQAAEALGVSVATAENDWAYARSWLRLEMNGAEK